MALNSDYIDQLTQIISDFVSHPVVITIFVVVFLSVFFFMKIYPYLENLR